MDFEFEPSELKGMDWANDDLFFTHSFVDETSEFDPKGRWSGGSDCYLRNYHCRVPIAFKNCEEMIDKFVCMIMDDYPDIEGFWVDVKEPYMEGLGGCQR